MPRVPLIAIVAILAMAGGATSAAAEEPIGTSVNTEVGVHFQIRAGGFLLELENNADDDDDEITLAVRGRRQFVNYIVEGDVTREGVEAKFGQLGEVSLAFEPTKTISTRKPPRRCKGDAAEELEGVYSGTFSFRGERGYVEAEATRVHGEMQIVPLRTCTYPRTRPFSRPRTQRAARGQAETAVISAGRDHELFGAIARRAPGESTTVFVANTAELREGMRVYRYTIAPGRVSTFLFDFKRGTASVRPPWPFQGSARFRRGPHGRNSWSGSLRVSMLGAGILDLTAPGFRAKISTEYHDE